MTKKLDLSKLEPTRREFLVAAAALPVAATLLPRAAQAETWVRLTRGASKNGFSIVGAGSGDTFQVQCKGVRAGSDRATGTHKIRCSGNPKTHVQVKLNAKGTGKSKKMPWSYGPPHDDEFWVEIWCPTIGGYRFPS